MMIGFSYMVESKDVNKRGFPDRAPRCVLERVIEMSMVRAGGIYSPGYPV